MPREASWVELTRFRAHFIVGGVPRRESTMPRSRPPYPREFRQEAMRLARESGKPLAQIARDLGVAYEPLRHWQADLDAGRPTDGLTTAEREELRRLRRENRVLREEREIFRRVPHAAWYGTSDRTQSNPSRLPMWAWLGAGDSRRTPGRDPLERGPGSGAAAGSPWTRTPPGWDRRWCAGAGAA